MLKYLPDIIFIAATTALLLYLAGTNNMALLIKWPFITIYLSYIVGRYVGKYSAKKQLLKSSS